MDSTLADTIERALGENTELTAAREADVHDNGECLCRRLRGV